MRRFWAKVSKTGTCWEWQGYCDPQGYGRVAFRGSAERAHRVSWFLKHGKLPRDLVLHVCDNRRCVRPDHLFLGTHADNAADRHAKGRSGDHRGERNGRAVLTPELVREIRCRYASGESFTSLGRRFGVSRVQARNVALRRSWASVEEEKSHSTL